MFDISKRLLYVSVSLSLHAKYVFMCCASFELKTYNRKLLFLIIEKCVYVETKFLLINNFTIHCHNSKRLMQTVALFFTCVFRSQERPLNVMLSQRSVVYLARSRL